LDHAIHHIADEHHWRDTMFKEFFEKFGPVKGITIKQWSNGQTTNLVTVS